MAKRKAGGDETGRRTTGSLAPAALEASLGYHFRAPELLVLALTHRSHPYELRRGASGRLLAPPSSNADRRNPPGTDNEQLEFLGDAVLGLAVTELLFTHFPDRSEGELTRLRSTLVSRSRMGEFAAELALGEYLRLGRSAEANGSRTKSAVLANAAEAVLAAIYLDATRAGDNGLAAVRDIADARLLQPELAALREALTASAGRGALRDSKTLLQERVQAGDNGRLRYVDTGFTGPPHQRRFAVEVRLETAAGEQVLAAAEGLSKKDAQQAAAELALGGWPASPAAASRPAAELPATAAPGQEDRP